MHCQFLLYWVSPQDPNKPARCGHTFCVAHKNVVGASKDNFNCFDSEKMTELKVTLHQSSLVKAVRLCNFIDKPKHHTYEIRFKVLLCFIDLHNEYNVQLLVFKGISEALCIIYQ